MWKLRIDDDQGNRTMVQLVRPEYAIGRGEHNSIRLTERNVSRSHAKLVLQDGAWVMIRLCDARQQLWVNGETVDSQVTLRHEDEIKIGDYVMEIADDSAPARNDRSTTLREVPVQREDVPLNRLVLIDGPTPGAQYPLFKPSLLIGRGEECDIPLNDSSVSRVHAELRRLSSGDYEITDRGSSNGIRINGVQQAEPVTLRGGDMMEFGDVVIRYVAAGDPNWYPETLGSQRPSATPVVPVGWSSRRRIAWGAAGAIAVCGLGALIWNSQSAPPPPENVIAEERSPTMETLKRAVALMSNDDVIGAHQILLDVPLDSNVREAPQFQEIERRWADLLFVAAEGEPDRELRRTILEQIASAPSVDTERRRRAADDLTRLAEPSQDVNDLPRTQDQVPVNASAPAAVAPQLSRATRPAPAGANQSVENKSPSNRTPDTRSPPTPKPAPAAEGTVIREAPF